MREPIDQAKWDETLNVIKGMITDVSYRTWISPLKPLEKDDEQGTFSLACTESFKANLIRQRYLTEIENAVASVFDRKYRVIISHKSDEEIKNIREKKTILKPTPEDSFREEYYLNPRYTFDNFIVGSNNNYAHAISLAVAESPADTYNPLFIYGGSGLGKTHLMHAIGNFILQKYPSKKVLYVSSEMFTTELIAALNDPTNRNSKLNSFKEKYRTVDVLLIDDIQFIEGKDATQLEFFHTFNTLYNQQKQIVISSDRQPSKLTLLDDRLRSRFQSDILADIQPPDFETRVAILRHKAEEEGQNLDDDFLQVIDLIAEKVKFNVREMESALTRVISFSAVDKDKPKITVAFAKSKLTDIFDSRDSTITCETIKTAVCKKYGIKLADMDSKKRNREYARPRQIAMYLCREMTDLSLPQIGQSFGGKDHTTVLHACNKVAEEMKTSSFFAEEVHSIQESLQ